MWVGNPAISHLAYAAMRSTSRAPLMSRQVLRDTSRAYGAPGPRTFAT